MKKQLFIKLLVIDAMITLALIALIWRFVLRSPITRRQMRNAL